MKIILPMMTMALMTHLSWAAIPVKKDNSNSISAFALEVLSMPEANRNLIAKQKSNELYPELIQLSKSNGQDMSTRWKALTLAASFKTDQSVNDLEAALQSKEWFLRNAALVALKTYHPLKAQKAAKELLKDKALVVRSAAVDVMGTQLDAKSRELLWQEFSASYNYRGKQSLWIREQILKQLSENPMPNESVQFVKALREASPDMHMPAIAALEKLTQKKMGPQKKVAQQRELWLQWAKAYPQYSVQ